MRGVGERVGDVISGQARVYHVMGPTVCVKIPRDGGRVRKTENLLKTVAAPAAFPRRLQISLGVRLHVKDEERSWFLIFNVIRGVRSWFAFFYVLMMPCLAIV